MLALDLRAGAGFGTPLAVRGRTGTVGSERPGEPGGDRGAAAAGGAGGTMGGGAGGLPGADAATDRPRDPLLENEPEMSRATVAPLSGRASGVSRDAGAPSWASSFRLPSFSVVMCSAAAEIMVPRSSSDFAS